ncbi:unnamed protein product [Cuscuta epithymum]|uniref:Ribosomal protein L32 n=1 Tax=Cuscuta epithymum TaxID=186058 RepID=A0AAV0GCY8_9ASTE|nr:unnamed protein product [Cuscuta epithymum]CAH9145448.1 unnamed protein product [Cuscuta epithymum]
MFSQRNQYGELVSQDTCGVHKSNSNALGQVKWQKNDLGLFRKVGPLFTKKMVHWKRPPMRNNELKYKTRSKHWKLKRKANVWSSINIGPPLFVRGLHRGSIYGPRARLCSILLISI